MMNYLDRLVPHVYQKHTKLITIGLPYNAGMLSPYYLHVYSNTTLTKKREYMHCFQYKV